MKIYDKDFNELENPDLALGKLESGQREIVGIWSVDVAEESHEEIVREYPETGGRDVEIIIDVAEVGHWQITDAENRTVDFAIPDDALKEQKFMSIEQYQRYTLYTAEESAEIERQKKEHEAEIAKAQEREEFLQTAPERVESVEVMTDDLVMMVAEIVGV